ncbi:hypothetical protein BDFG_06730 [Blastomyces dermatitidis ATCC 26199]|nr:hypothetical protein BDFG_06730 [Blastomyces dermatitidis ATCC 26199]
MDINLHLPPPSLAQSICIRGSSYACGQMETFDSSHAGEKKKKRRTFQPSSFCPDSDPRSRVLLVLPLYGESTEPRLPPPPPPPPSPPTTTPSSTGFRVLRSALCGWRGKEGGLHICPSLYERIYCWLGNVLLLLV